jgi:uncharacterized protein with predicted RNA binding PUA domain
LERGLGEDHERVDERPGEQHRVSLQRAQRRTEGFNGDHVTSLNSHKLFLSVLTDHSALRTPEPVEALSRVSAKAERMSTDGASDATDAADADAEDLERLRIVADYQFGAGAGTALFPVDDDLELRRSTSGRPRQVHAAEGRLVSYGTDGRFTLGLTGGRRLIDALAAPAYRVVVGDESEPFVREGKNVFAKFVAEVDPDVRPGDEVAVVHENGDLLGVGRAELSGAAMLDFRTGMAVKVREGAGQD